MICHSARFPIYAQFIQVVSFIASQNEFDLGDNAVLQVVKRGQQVLDLKMRILYLRLFILDAEKLKCG